MHCSIRFVLSLGRICCLTFYVIECCPFCQIFVYFCVCSVHRYLHNLNILYCMISKELSKAAEWIRTRNLALKRHTCCQVWKIRLQQNPSTHQTYLSTLDKRFRSQSRSRFYYGPLLVRTKLFCFYLNWARDRKQIDEDSFTNKESKHRITLCSGFATHANVVGLLLFVAHIENRWTIR